MSAQIPLWHPNDERLLLIVPGKPERWERHVGKGGRAFTPPGAKKQMTRIANEAARLLAASIDLAGHGSAFPTGPLELRTVFVFEPPKHPETARPYPTRVDLDNLVKLVMDACGWHLNVEKSRVESPGKKRIPGMIWRDDAQVVTLFARKRYAAHPRTEIQIRRTF